MEVPGISGVNLRYTAVAVPDTPPSFPPADDAAEPTPPSRWQKLGAAARRAAGWPGNGLSYLYHTSQANRHFTLPVLNGAFGDQLADRHDPRAIQMSFRRHGSDVPVAQLHLSPERRKTVVFLHGLMGDELIWQTGAGAAPRFGPRLQQELHVHCLYVRFNSGLHISENGHLLSQLLTELVAAYPEATQELVLVGHSMGGLVIRSAGYYGALASTTPNPDSPSAEIPLAINWVKRLKTVFLLGVPNEGSFLEQNSYLTSMVLRKINLRPTRFVSELIDRRSNGIKDLRYARLVDEDWQHPQANDLLPPRTLVPPLPGVHYHILVGSLLKSTASALAHYFGDGLVGAGSALGTVFGDPALPPDVQVSTRTFAQQHHGSLISNEQVYQYLRENSKI